MDSVQKMKTVRDVMRNMKVFITVMCITGPLSGIVTALLYRWMVTRYGQWDMAKDSFYFGIIIYGLGVTLPILSISCRLMIKMFFQNCEQIENLNFIVGALKSAHEKAPALLENVQTVVDKAVPIANNIEEIVGRAKAMSSDVEAITHKVRTTMDALNGSLDVKVLEGHFREVKDSLKTIADTFGGGQKSLETASEIELVPGGGRRKK